MSSTNEQPVKLDLWKEIKLPSGVLGADATADGLRAFAACMDRGVYEIDVLEGTFNRIGEHQSYASGVIYLPESNRLISAGYDGALQWHDLESRKTIRKVQAHKFWSWQMAVSPDERFVASVTGQYLPGGYKYEPAAEQEPSVRVFDAQSGELVHSLSHQPPVLSVAFSPDSKFVAAGTMMGNVKVWEVSSGKQVAEWTTPDFTSWGIIKSHHYIGGIFGLTFTPDGEGLIACGMGPMRDPMAGNGKQTWQQFAWHESPASKTREINEGDSGNGLMETIAFHPGKEAFVMAGRLAQGKWNAAFFSPSGKLLHSVDTKMRVTDSIFAVDGKRLFLAGATGQERKKDGAYPPFGRLKVYDCELQSTA